MANKPPIVRIDEIETRAFSHGEQFAALLGRIGPQLGMQKLGCSLVVLEPGKRGWPHHLHYEMEELFIVLEGEGTLRYDDGEYPIRAGEIFFAPTGPGTAHQIINTSDGELKYLALSTTDQPEICYYPDSKKIGAFVWREDGSGIRFMAREDSAVDYYDGE